MAQVMTGDTVDYRPWLPWVRLIGVGAGLGLVFWLLTLLLGRYVVEPITCRQIAEASLCTNATALAGNLAAIFTALIGAIVLVRLRMLRPLIAPVATAALLWELGAWTLGLGSVETIFWSIFLYATSYLLFTWISKYTQLWVAIAISALIVLIVRIALVL